MQNIPRTRELFDLNHTIAKNLLKKCEYPHQALSHIKSYIKDYTSLLDNSYKEIEENVFVAEDTFIWREATIQGPTIIGHNVEVRPGAFIRGNVIIGDNAVIGNSTEIKNSIIFNEAQLPHYNYIGDSIIGYKAHMGAGAIASNLRLDRKNIKIGETETGLRKIGVFLGDYAEVGCGAVLCPGTIVGKYAVIYPLSTARGVILNGEIYGKERV